MSADLERALEALRSWFNKSRRPLPWRDDPTPYKVWISEVMLQQTRADVVTAYYTRWLRQFPDIASLAQAPLQQVLKAWEGLGYYERGRNLHRAARQIVDSRSGQFPANEPRLRELAGVGSYTAAAIAAFALHQRAAPVDGNVMRVLTRWLALDVNISELRAQRQLQSRLLELLPQKRPWEVAEGLIELGALICQKIQPKCELCPLRPTCQARSRDQIDRFPHRQPRPKSQPLFRLALLVTAKSRGERFALARKTLERKVMRDLWEFPYLELPVKERALVLSARDHWQRVLEFGGQLASSCGLTASLSTCTPPIRHTFTRFRVVLLGLCGTCSMDVQLPRDPLWEYRFVNLSKLAQLPFSSGHRKLLKYLL